MPAIVLAMINDEAKGDSNAVSAIASKVNAAEIRYYQDGKPAAALAELEATINPVDQYVLVISGPHGLKLLAAALKSDAIQALIAQQRLTISWSGHKPTADFAQYIPHLNVVGLLHEAITPKLRAALGTRLLDMEFVPNTLTVADMQSGTALLEWNINHPHAQIPDSPTGYIFANLPGDAPDETDAYKYYPAAEAYNLGVALAKDALASKQFLLATNGPRIGRYYADSPDAKKPIMRRFRTDGANLAWQELSELSQQEIEDPTPQNKPHIKGAPLDPISAAFLAGLEAGGLPATQFLFVDFDGESAYAAMACAAYKYKDTSTAIYGAESISLAELGMFFKTYAFTVNVMCDLHTRFLDRIHTNYHRVAKAEVHASGLMITSNVKDNLKLYFRGMNPERDAQKIAEKINAQITVGKPLLPAAKVAADLKQEDSILKDPSSQRPRQETKNRLTWDQT